MSHGKLPKPISPQLEANRWEMAKSIVEVPLTHVISSQLTNIEMIHFSLDLVR